MEMTWAGGIWTAYEYILNDDHMARLRSLVGRPGGQGCFEGWLVAGVDNRSSEDSTTSRLRLCTLIATYPTYATSRTHSLAAGSWMKLQGFLNGEHIWNREIDV